MRGKSRGKSSRPKTKDANLEERAYLERISKGQAELVRRMKQTKKDIAAIEKANAPFENDFFAKFKKTKDGYETVDKYFEQEEIIMHKGRKGILIRTDGDHDYVDMENGVRDKILKGFNWRTADQTSRELFDKAEYELTDAEREKVEYVKVVKRGEAMEHTSSFVVELLHAAKETFPHITNEQLNYLQAAYTTLEHATNAEQTQENALRSYVTINYAADFEVGDMSPLTKSIHATTLDAFKYDNTAKIEQVDRMKMIQQIQSIEIKEFIDKKPYTEVGRVAKKYNVLMEHTKERVPLKQKAVEWASKPLTTVKDFAKNVLGEKTTQKETDLER